MLPQEIQDRIFLELGSDNIGFETLEKTRDIQSYYVRQCTQFNDIEKAAECGNLDNIKWLRTNGHEWYVNQYFGQSYVFRAAVKFGDFNIIKWLYENGCPLKDYELTEIAAENDDFECMKWLHKMGCELSPEIFQITATLGDLDMMKWLHENGCSWSSEKYDDSIFYAAAIFGNLDNMKWLHENGCPWDEYAYIGTIEFAYNDNNIDQALDNIKWLYENNCPYGSQTFSEAIDLGNIEIIRWLYNNLDKYILL